MLNNIINFIEKVNECFALTVIAIASFIFSGTVIGGAICGLYFLFIADLECGL